MVRNVSTSAWVKRRLPFLLLRGASSGNSVSQKRISEVATPNCSATSLIRFWETEFDELRPRKSKKGNRLFTQADVDTFRTIYHLVKERGYTIPGAREMMKTKGGQLKDKIDVIQSLEKVRGFLVSLKKEIDAAGRAE